MGKETSPYVISSDVQGLLEHWAKPLNIQLPQNGVLTSLTKELQETLKGYFDGNIEIVDEEKTKAGLEELAADSKFPIISLDRAYVNSETPNVTGYIDATRAVDENYKDLGLLERPGFAKLNKQIQEFASDKVSPITLLDDVVFGGKGIIELAEMLKKINRPVDSVITGIGIRSGIDLIESEGIKVLSVYEYNQVVDEVCERDFRASIPMSGRSVYATNGEVYSAPYFKPFGDAVNWASIPPEHEKDFSECCLSHSITIWEAMEKATGRKISTNEVPRKIKDVSQQESISEALRSFK